MNQFFTVLKAYWLLIVSLLLIAVITGGYVAGFRIDQGGITRVGTLVLTGLPAQTAVYVDQARLVKIAGERAAITMTPGTHSVIIDTQEYLPWNEIVTIEQGKDTVKKPILIPAKPKGVALTGEHFQKALDMIKGGVIPTAAAPLVLSGGCANVYLSGTHILAERATTTPCATPPPYICASDADVCAPVIVYSPNGTVHSIVPFPSRDDAVIVSAGNLVYVVELDPREPQFFAPLFKGPSIGAAVFSDHSAVVSNGTQVVELSL